MKSSFFRLESTEAIGISTGSLNSGTNGGKDYRGPDRLAMLNPLQPVESRLTLPFLPLWHSNDRRNRQKKEGDSRTGVGIVTSSGNRGKPSREP